MGNIKWASALTVGIALGVAVVAAMGNNQLALVGAVLAVAFAVLSLHDRS